MDGPTSPGSVLVGLLIDVSGSMASSIKNSKYPQNRLESFRDALDHLVRKHASAVESQEHGSTAELFAYGFGFGNPLNRLFGKQGPLVRDLLLLPGMTKSTVDVATLGKEWQRYKSHVEGLATEMLGSTPMKEGLITIRDRFQAEAGHPKANRILFLLSDGEPDSPAEQVIEVAQELKGDGIFVVSCFVTNEDLAEPRRIYGQAPSHWSPGAKLMFECSSLLSVGSPFHSYLKEYGWSIDDNGRMFTQINQSELLSEFMNVVLSPATETAAAVAQIDSGKDQKPMASPRARPRSDPGTNSQLARSHPAVPSDTPLKEPPLAQTDENHLSLHEEHHRTQTQAERPNWPAWVFGGILVLFFMSIVWFKPQVHFDPTQEKLLRILASVLVGVISGFFAGALRLEGKVPMLKDMQIGAIGGFAGFALTFFLW
jgi:hypothetical protein